MEARIGYYYYNYLYRHMVWILHNNMKYSYYYGESKPSDDKDNCHIGRVKKIGD